MVDDIDTTNVNRHSFFSKAFSCLETYISLGRKGMCVVLAGLFLNSSISILSKSVPHAFSHDQFFV